MPLVAALGLVEPGARLAWWAFSRLAREGALPVGNPLDAAREPLSRVGDLLVWNGADGQRVLGGLESLQATSLQVAGNLAGVQQGQTALFGLVQSTAALALVPLGLGALAAGVLLSRLAVITKQLNGLADRIDELKDLVAADHEADLSTALKQLEAHESHPEEGQLADAHKLALRSTSLYGGSLEREMAKRRRVEVLDQIARHHCLAILADTRALMHGGQIRLAEKQITDELPKLKAYAQALFDLTLGGRGGLFLHADFIGSGVTLEVLSEAYSLARTAGVAVDVDDPEPAALHEILRKRTGGFLSKFKSSGVRARTAELKYLLAGLEDVNRIQSLQLRLRHTLENRYSAAEIEAELAHLREQSRARAEARVSGPGSVPVMAYRFAGGAATAE